jgi:hypothetical protein
LFEQPPCEWQVVLQKLWQVLVYVQLVPVWVLRLLLEQVVLRWVLEPLVLVHLLASVRRLSLQVWLMEREE